MSRTPSGDSSDITRILLHLGADLRSSQILRRPSDPRVAPHGSPDRQNTTGLTGSDLYSRYRTRTYSRRDTHLLLPRRVVVHNLRSPKLNRTHDRRTCISVSSSVPKRKFIFFHCTIVIITLGRSKNKVVRGPSQLKCNRVFLVSLLCHD